MVTPFPKISRREWLGAALVGVLAALIGSWPWILSAWRAHTGLVYLGTNIPDVLDSQVYYAFIQGSASHGAYANLFTSVAQPAALWNPLWWLLGQIVRFSGLTPVTVFWAAKAILGVGLVMMIYRLAAVVFQAARWRLVALGLAVFGGGFGWLALLALHQHAGLVWLYQRTDLISVLPTDLTYSAGYVWMSILHSPLFVLAEMLLLSIWGLLVMTMTRPKKSLIHLAGLLTLLLGFVHPYDLIILFGVIMASVIIGIVGVTMNQAQVKKVFQYGGWLLLWSLPAVLYYALLVWFVPSVSEWNANNLLQTTNFRNVLVGFGALSIFSFFGIRAWWGKNTAGMYLIGWLAMAIALMYLPLLRWQAKMILGLSLPVGFLATAGIEHLWTGRRPPGKKILMSLGIVSAIMTPIIFLARTSESQQAEMRYHYASAEVIEALQWLKTYTPIESVVLGDLWTGNLVPQYAERATYLGHHHQTANYQSKLTLVRQWFFLDNSSPAEKAQFLAANHINFVVWGPNEQRLGTFVPTSISLLAAVYSNSTVSLYRVNQ